MGDDPFVTTVAEPASKQVTDEGAVVLPAAGYELGDVIGRGGMGEVVAARDRRIGRDVAVKRMHGTQSAAAVSRFLREARIQARLDHPAIVPVHELGVDEAGRPYFTMKRLAGVTLAERLAEMLIDHASTQRLLRAFVDVCLAVELAHTRGIVHRDLKPANIMLGDYGEVYVLDWGVARELASATVTEGGAAEADDEDEATEPVSITRAGAVLGTPGYMAPEQVRGEQIGTPADVYALGSILFEILTREPLHPPGKAALVATLTGTPDTPAQRRPERGIAPELDQACHAALADEPADRPSARDLANRIQRYLDGDRDLERRRALADEQLALARAAIAADRAIAMRCAGRALALDPESTEAAGLVTQLLLERPAELPAPLVASLEASERETLRTRSRRATFAYSMVFAFLVFITFLDIKSVPWLVGFYAMQGALVLFALHGTREGKVSPHLSMLGNFVLAVVWTRIAGPFMLAPVMICGAMLAVSSHPWNQRRPWTIFGWIAATALAPFVLEAIGVLDRTWKIANDSIVITSQIYRLEGAVGAGTLIVAQVAFLVLFGAFAFTVIRTSREAQRELHIQAWHLRHLLPEQRA
jgi:serine/threonine-protein kinase